MPKDPICGMNVDEAHAFRLKQDGHIYYFCSERCLKKYAIANNIDIEEKTEKGCVIRKQKKWYKDKTIIAAVSLLFLCIISYIFPILEPFRLSLFMYIKKIWLAVLAGFIIGGIIDHFIPREYISYILARPKKRTIIYSVILGFFMSACSHGILALSIELHKKGASNPAVVTFLLASPWANLPITFMLIGFFGLKALYIIISALFVAVITGFIYQFLEVKNLIEVNHNIKEIDEGFSVLNDIKVKARAYKLSLQQLKKDTKAVFDGAIALADMVLWWLLIGMGLASFAGAYIPQNIFQHYMGPTVIGFIVTLVVATILEVCSEGTAPLAFEIYRQTGALGNSFVFLMAGVVTDYTEIGLLWHNVGKRVAIWLPVITVPQVVILGVLANILF